MSVCVCVKETYPTFVYALNSFQSTLPTLILCFIYFCLDSEKNQTCHIKSYIFGGEVLPKYCHHDHDL